MVTKPAADPIFALIAEHKAADKELCRVGNDAAWSAWHRASMRLARTKPTTFDGTGTFVAYIARDSVHGASDWHVPALKTCAAALRAMTRAELLSRPESWRGGGDK